VSLTHGAGAGVRNHSAQRASLPADFHPGASDAATILIRSDSAGATYDFAAACRNPRVGFSFGREITEVCLSKCTSWRRAQWYTDRDWRILRRREAPVQTAKPRPALSNECCVS
jgi:hypothetical protein